ncbi:MAG: ABC transporter permease, partial [Halobacteriaceae archaeon]
QGLQAAVTQQFQSLGKDVLIIRPQGAGFGPQGESTPDPLTENDQDVIEKTTGVVETAALLFRSARIEFKDKVNFQIVTGLPLDREEERDLAQRATTMEVMKGRNLASGDRFDALVGIDYTERDGVFDQQVRLGDKVDIKNTSFDVVGILEEIGTPTDDRQIVIPLETAEELLDVREFKGDHVRDYIAAKIDPAVDINDVRETMERQLRNERDLDEGEEDFQIETAQDLQESFNSIIGIVQAVLVGIAA